MCLSLLCVRCENYDATLTLIKERMPFEFTPTERMLLVKLRDSHLLRRAAVPEDARTPARGDQDRQAQLAREAWA